MNTKKVTQDLWLAINDVNEDEEIIVKDKIRQLFQLFNLCLDLFAQEELIRFTTLFAKISWICTRLGLSPRLTYLLQTFRRSIERQEIPKDESLHYYHLGLYLCNQLLHHADNVIPHQFPLEKSVDDYFKIKTEHYISFVKMMDGIVIAIDEPSRQLIFVEDGSPDKERKVIYDVADRNELFTNNISSIKKILHLPVQINLIDVQINSEGVLFPSAFIIHPDYLIDVTSIAGAAKDYNGEHWLYSLNKFYLKETSLAIHIGNLVNSMLDRLIQDPELLFPAMLSSFFTQDPIQWALYSDDDVKEGIAKLNIHFDNVKQVVNHEFPKKEIDRSKVYLEPSFYCRDYGIQGRLDLLQYDAENMKADIIELKSSKPYRPNVYGITHSHYLQTLLYDLIIASTFKGKIKAMNYILYSSSADNPLRYAPVTRTQQYELMKIRNELMFIEHAISLSASMALKIVSFLKPSNFSDVKGFISTDLRAFENIYTSLDEIEKLYYGHFLAFVAKEQILAKTGEYGINKSNGLSSLWREDVDEKIERFSILNHLQILKNNSSEAIPLIEFGFTEFSAKLSNFRIGDVVVLYPHSFNRQGIMHHQIFKSTIISFTDEGIVLRLRSPQKNQQIFGETEFWNIEQDVLDSTYRHMFGSLFTFIAADEEKRRLIMGIQRPEIFKAEQVLDLDHELTPEQKNILLKMYYCKDYFLLWGPPGTGKTSMIIKHFSRLLYQNTNERFLLLAYTNKAVDEINEALIEAGLAGQMTRIGSSFSVHEKYSQFLLQKQTEHFHQRREVLNFLNQSRIVLSTVSSLLGKQELFKLIAFDTVIVDEASQIPEPMLCGLLTKFKRFILVGDHKQLPSVVTQSPAESLIKDEKLISQGFYDTRTSLFERLFLQCKTKDWFHSWSILTHQGRMHREIMDFVNHQFYESNLKIIASIPRLVAAKKMVNSSGLLSQKRMIFINSATEKGYQIKTNEDEATKVCDLIKKIKTIYDENGLIPDEGTLGVITPYRAQIALIKSMNEIDFPLTIDTVERFQGGARDIIIMSLCTNKLSQMERLVSSSSEGVDRKLNVAITRAREQLIVVGNREILESNETYKQLLEVCTELTL